MIDHFIIGQILRGKGLLWEHQQQKYDHLDHDGNTEGKDPRVIGDTWVNKPGTSQNPRIKIKNELIILILNTIIACHMWNSLSLL